MLVGDPKRGYGILDNERYLGRLNWGRLRWKRGAPNSRKRTAVIADSGLLVTRERENAANPTYGRVGLGLSLPGCSMRQTSLINQFVIIMVAGA